MRGCAQQGSSVLNVSNCPNGYLFVQMLEKYKKADPLLSVSRIIPLLSIIVYLDYLFPVIYLGKDSCTVKSFTKTKQQLHPELRRGKA